MSKQTVYIWNDEANDDVEVELPTMRAICGRCNGDGVHSNPSIDGNGISAREFRDDPEFAEAYFSGQYDVSCYECGGNKIVDIVNEDALSPELREAWHEQLEQERQHDAEMESERRMGC